MRMGGPLVYCFWFLAPADILNMLSYLVGPRVFLRVLSATVSCYATRTFSLSEKSVLWFIRFDTSLLRFSSLHYLIKGPRYFSQTWAYVVNFEKTFSLRSGWGQLMLPFISYGMKNEVDRRSFLWEFSTRGPQKIFSMGFTVARILSGILTKQYFFD